MDAHCWLKKLFSPRTCLVEVSLEISSSDHLHDHLFVSNPLKGAMP